MAEPIPIPVPGETLKASWAKQVAENVNTLTSSANNSGPVWNNKRERKPSASGSVKLIGSDGSKAVVSDGEIRFESGADSWVKIHVEQNGNGAIVTFDVYYI